MLYWNDWFSCYKKPPVTWTRPIQLCMDQWVAVSDSGDKLRVTLICLAFLLACVFFLCSECIDLFYDRPFLTCHSRRSAMFLIYKISLYTWERKPDSKCSNKHAGAGGGNNVETKKNILSMRTSELILFK